MGQIFRPQIGQPLGQVISHIGFKAAALFILALASMWPAAMSLVSIEKKNYFNIDEQAISTQISEAIAEQHYPQTIQLPSVSIDGALQIQYTIDPALQEAAERLLAKHNPDHAVIVALDPSNGHVLAMAQSTRDTSFSENLILSNTFPAASVSKIITAVAALNENEVGVSTIIPFNGKSTSLYKRNVFNHKKSKWTRTPSFSESFAKSINTVFGRLGAVQLGGDKLKEYFYRMGFNARFASDFFFENGRIDIDADDSWQVAESASGYTTRNTLSPLHGAALAATALNGGQLIAPVIVSSIHGPNGIPIYRHQEPASSKAMEPATAEKLKKVMQATVSQGSAKKSFRRFHRGHRKDIIVGGKTGSLTGFNPKGRYDWFVGFGQQGDREIAYAVLCINKEKWYVKSTRLAREFLEFYFDPDNINTEPKVASNT